LRDGAGIEMDAGQLADTVRAVVGEACGGLGAIAGVGVTGMGEAGVLTGRAGEPLAPIRAWHDPRGDTEQVGAALGEKAFHQAVGMRLDAQPSLPKILRLRRDHPGCAAATRFWSVPEWAVRSLGGEPGSELSLASRTGLLDVVTGRPWAGALELLGADLLGTLQPAGTPDGLAQALDGAPNLAGAVLTVGGHDHQCAALAAGAAKDGTLFDSLGTAEALLRFTAGPVDAVTVGSLAAAGVNVGLTVVAGHYCVMAGLRTGMGLERLAAAVGARNREQRARLADAAVALLDDPEAMAGIEIESLPGGVRLTLLREAGPEQIWAAAVSRLVAAAQPSIDRVRAAVGQDISVLAAGGWFADAAVLAAKRRQFPSLVTTAVTEAGAAGAAYLSGVAAGLFTPAESLDGAPWQAARTSAVSTIPAREVL
ncbi:MAG TPA: FGGY family carbohydrate kinase, partial [Kineosporiaceae bacterium]|nr:FGGY family carbohydrate kinase [Kineosporiaceae bacterium]